MSARKAMNAKEYTRSNKWAAHVKIQKMNQKEEVGQTVFDFSYSLLGIESC